MMSKKHKAEIANTSQRQAQQSDEFNFVKRDLIKVVVLNVVFLAILLAVYYGNHRHPFLENWLGRFVRF